MNRLHVTYLALLLTAAIGTPALAAPGPGPAGPPQDGMGHPSDWHPGPGAGLNRILGQLDLTADQRQQLKEIFEKARPKMQALGERARANREQLMLTAPTDRAYAALLATAKSNAAEAIQQMSDLWTQAYAVLTPQQRAKIPEVIASEKARADARRQAWKDGQPPTSK